MLYKITFGFRHDHSTTHALIELTQKIRLANYSKVATDDVLYHPN